MKLFLCNKLLSPPPPPKLEIKKLILQTLAR